MDNFEGHPPARPPWNRASTRLLTQDVSITVPAGERAQVVAALSRVGHGAAVGAVRTTTLRLPPRSLTSAPIMGWPETALHMRSSNRRST